MSVIMWVIHSFFALIFSLGLYLLWFRLGCHYLRFNKDNAVVKWVTKVTNPVIAPLFSLFPQKSVIEWPTFLFIIIFEFIKIYLLTLIVYGRLPSIGVVSIVVVGDLLIFPLQLWFYAFILRVLMNWIPSLGASILKEVVYGMTDPCMNYSRDWMSPVGGYDFLPLAWIMILKGLSFFVYISMPLHVG